MNPNLIILSHPAVGPYAAATYKFFTKEYKPPASPRDMDSDVIHNANGKFKYVYDNGPGFRKWEPFTVRCEEIWQKFLGKTASEQLAQLMALWEYPANLVLGAPEGTYNVHWAVDTDLEQAFIIFPREVGQAPEYDVMVQFEEA